MQIIVSAFCNGRSEIYTYTIYRKYYGLPDYLSHCMENDEDGVFIFDTEYEANECLKQIFANGDWIEDEKYGKCRYYAGKI